MKIFSFNLFGFHFSNTGWWYFPTEWYWHDINKTWKWWHAIALSFEIKKIPDADPFPYKKYLTIYVKFFDKQRLVHISRCRKNYMVQGDAA